MVVDNTDFRPEKNQVHQFSPHAYDVIPAEDDLIMIGNNDSPSTVIKITR